MLPSLADSTDYRGYDQQKRVVYPSFSFFLTCFPSSPLLTPFSSLLVSFYFCLIMHIYTQGLRLYVARKDEDGEIKDEKLLLDLSHETFSEVLSFPPLLLFFPSLLYSFISLYYFSSNSSLGRTSKVGYYLVQDSLVSLYLQFMFCYKYISFYYY